MDGIDTLLGNALRDIADASTLDAVEHLRVFLLGKQGSVTTRLKALGTLPPDQRKAAGEEINRARDAITDALAARKHGDVQRFARLAALHHASC